MEMVEAAPALRHGECIARLPRRSQEALASWHLVMWKSYGFPDMMSKWLMFIDFHI
jgi:hypothetical protein